MVLEADPTKVDESQSPQMPTPLPYLGRSVKI